MSEKANVLDLQVGMVFYTGLRVYSAYDWLVVGVDNEGVRAARYDYSEKVVKLRLFSRQRNLRVWVLTSAELPAHWGCHPDALAILARRYPAASNLKGWPTPPYAYSLPRWVAPKPKRPSLWQRIVRWLV